MKNIFLILVIFIVSCSNNSQNFNQQNDSNQTPNEETAISNQETLIDFTDSERLYVYSDLSLNQYGNILSNFLWANSFLLETNLFFENKTSNPIEMDIKILDIPENYVQIKTNRCIGYLNPGKRCSVNLSTLRNGVPNGNYYGRLKLTNEPNLSSGGETVLFQLFVNTDYNPNFNYPTNMAQTKLISTNFSNFNDFQLGNRLSKKMIISNTGNSDISNFSVSIPQFYSVKLNRCSSVLKKGSFCSVILYYNSKTRMPELTDKATISGDGLTSQDVFMISQ